MTTNTSGVNTFELTRNQICTMALQGAGVIGAEEVPSAADLNYAASMLNALMKTWEADNMGNWAQTEGTLYLILNQAIYSIGTPNPANASSNNVVETTLTSDAISSATNIIVDSISNNGISYPATMLVDDNIGIVLTTGAIQWTTISSISGTTITLNDALSADADIGTNVYSYTSVMSRPMNITQVRYRNSQGIDRQMTRLARDDYFALPTKTTQSQPLCFYYDFQLNNGTLFIWPTPDSTLGRIKFTYTRTLDDLVNTGDNPDFPQEFLLPLVYNLAAMIAPTYGKEVKLQTIGPIADSLKKIAKEYDVDEGSLYMVPDNLGRQD